MQKIIVIRGAPSSGKSTIAKRFRSYKDKTIWLKVDNFKDFFAKDASEALNYVNSTVFATLKYLVSKEFSVVMYGVFQAIKRIRIDIDMLYVYYWSMTSKLTLSINSEILENSKKYLQSRNQSLSGLVEEYFRLLIKTKKKKVIGSPILRELIGMAKNVKKKEKEVITEYLQEKYS